MAKGIDNVEDLPPTSFRRSAEAEVWVRVVCSLHEHSGLGLSPLDVVARADSIVSKFRQRNASTPRQRALQQAKGKDYAY